MNQDTKRILHWMDDNFIALRSLHNEFVAMKKDGTPKLKRLNKDIKIIAAMQQSLFVIDRELAEGNRAKFLSQMKIPPLKLLHEGMVHIDKIKQEIMGLRDRIESTPFKDSTRQREEIERDIQAAEQLIAQSAHGIKEVENHYASIENPFPLPRQIRTKIDGVSWNSSCPISMDDLSYIQPHFFDFNGNSSRGEMIVHKSVAAEAFEIFSNLHENRFPIEKMKLIDDYGGKDEPSVIDNNSSAFVSRKITNAGAKNPTKFSYHAYGLAIDINPKINPFVECEEKTKDNWVILENSVIPKTATQFLDRNQKYPGIVHKDEFCYNLFISKGWSWGGNWTTLKDWQHFQKDF